MTSLFRFSGKARLIAAIAASLPLFAGAMPPGMDMPMAHGHDMRGEDRHGNHGPHGGGLMPLLHGLTLDEAQQDKIFQIHHALEPQVRDQHKALMKARKALSELALSGQYSDARGKPIADAIARSSGELALLHARAESQILAVLTPEQRASVETTRKRMEAERGRPMPGMQGTPPGAPGAQMPPMPPAQR
ncbi:Spy/CpxP family protein refolding chaperone [Noviherbaspirillum galbum]|uniref:Spy/CpxP family protein refolding chaperone n=1 Tax=Noviherbaspirillum galbum TaxID=2709383 RepID=A0A6B3SKZ6_9BURK|nr:Spy/CpxP family protein refolding chaperone [Noviherbaspirillum galbum]NEX60035.1 Spy/CpxP family protein refolding chaperone [Noviherbaspirillum galbum]